MKRNAYLAALLIAATMLVCNGARADFMDYLESQNQAYQTEDSIPAEVRQPDYFEKTTTVETAVVKEAPFYTNWTPEEAQRIVNRIGEGLKYSNSINFALNFLIVDKEEVNACTDIENNIYVYSGILPYVEKEDELAFIIGHEMGHAASKHVIKSAVTNEAAGVANTVGKSVLQSKVTDVAARKLGGLGYGFGDLAGRAVVNAGNVATDTVTTAATSTLQRGRENDADLLGIDYLVKKGYNPLAGISIMYKIGDVYPDLFVDHPSTDKRVVTMYNYVAEKYPQYLSKGFDTDAYREAVSKYVRR